MPKFIPVIGEAYTAAESVSCLAVSGAKYLCGDTKGAEEWKNAAGQAWVEYAEGNYIVTPIYAATVTVMGDPAKGDELMKKYDSAFENTLDGIPVVGHGKAIYHYVRGETEKGNRSIEASTRTTAILGAAAATGGVGGFFAAAAYDATATGIDYAINGDKSRYHGNLNLIEADRMTPNELTQSIMGVAGDCLTAKAGSKLGKNISAHMSKSAGQRNLVKAYTEAGAKDPRQATRLTMETAKAAKEVHAGLERNVNGCTTKVVDATNGRSGVGHSRGIRGEMRAQNYEQNGFTSRTAARRPTAVGTSSSHLKQTCPGVGKVLDRRQSACAEHQAFNNYNCNNPGYSSRNTNTATVYHNRGQFSTIERCGNCKEYGSDMGNVCTDQLPHGTPVPPESYISAPETARAWSVATGATILQQKSILHHEKRSQRFK